MQPPAALAPFQRRTGRGPAWGLLRTAQSGRLRSRQERGDVSSSATLEALSYAEKEIEVRGPINMRRHRSRVRVVRIRDIDRIKRRIDVHRKVKPDRANRRAVAKSNTDRMG